MSGMKRIVEVASPIKCPYRKIRGVYNKPTGCGFEGVSLVCDDECEFPEDCPLNCGVVEKIVKASGPYSGRVFLPGVWVGKLVVVVLSGNE